MLRDHTPVLIDFGAVREAMGTQVNAQGQSTQSIVIGTPGFMPSEQSIGRAVFASDLYSLGLTAIYTLTGKIPQELPTDPMTGEIQWRHFAPTVSAGLANVIDKAIALGVQGRFPTAKQMLDALISSDAPSGIPGTVMSMPSNAMPSNAMPSNSMPTQVSHPPMSGAMPTVVDPSMNYPSQPQYPPQYPQQPQYQQPPQYQQQPPSQQQPQSQPQYPQSQYPQPQYPQQQPQSQYPQQQPPQYSQQPQSQYPQQPQSQYPQQQPGYVQPVARRTLGGIPIVAVAIAAGLLCVGLGVLANSWLSAKSCETNQEKVDGKCVDIKKAGTSDSSGSGSSSPKTFKDVPNIPGLTVRYGGSTSFASLRSKTIVDKIQGAHPQFVLSYTEPTLPDKPGSGNGIKMLIEGQMSVAQSSRAVKDEEFAKAKDRNITLDQIPVAIDGIAVYVNNQASVQSLTLAQVKDIFTGKVTNWKEVGGADLAIVPISRDPKDGGTPEYFEEKVMAKEPFAASVQPYVRDTTEELRKVAQSPGAISYAAAPGVCSQASVKALSIAKESGQPPISPCNGKQVNKADFSKDVYPITRRLFVVVRKDGKLDEQAGNAYANLLLSDEGQQLVEEAGLVPLRVR